MKTISLTQGKFALVDDGDYDELMRFKWFARLARGHWSVRRDRGNVLMHREILRPPQGVEVDHRDRNGLNNQRANLRICTDSQNNWNRSLHSNNSTGFKGVQFRREGTWSSYRAVIRFHTRPIHIGYFETAIEAALAYDRKALELFGEFAATNRDLGLLT